MRGSANRGAREVGEARGGVRGTREEAGQCRPRARGPPGAGSGSARELAEVGGRCAGGAGPGLTSASSLKSPRPAALLKPQRQRVRRGPGRQQALGSLGRFFWVLEPRPLPANPAAPSPPKANIPPRLIAPDPQADCVPRSQPWHPSLPSRSRGAHAPLALRCFLSPSSLSAVPSFPLFPRPQPSPKPEMLCSAPRPRMPRRLYRTSICRPVSPIPDPRVVGSEPQGFALFPGSFLLAKSSPDARRAQPASSGPRAGVLRSLKRPRTHLALRTHCRSVLPARHLQHLTCKRTQGRRPKATNFLFPARGAAGAPASPARFPLGALGWRWGPGSVPLAVGASTCAFQGHPSPRFLSPASGPESPSSHRSWQVPGSAAPSAPCSPAWASRSASNGSDSLARRAWRSSLPPRTVHSPQRRMD